MAFQPGQSGNPGGRRKEKPFADALRMEIAAAGEDHRSLRAIARALLDKASSGDMQAIKELADRTDGKVPQGLIGGDEGDPELKLIVNIGGDAPNNG
jgi:hypothetical protein